MNALGGLFGQQRPVEHGYNIKVELRNFGVDLRSIRMRFDEGSPFRLKDSIFVL